MNDHNMEPKFVICINNKDYEASLEARKVFQVLVDEDAAKVGLLRIIDESGEDYLYPAKWFLPINVTDTVEKALLAQP